MAERRFYWLKLPVDFFRQKEIKRLRQISGGDTFVIIYLKMLLLSLKDNGRLFYDNLMDDFVSELALDLDENMDDVGVTVNFLLKAGILVETTSSEYEILTAQEMTGTETSSAVRKRRSRAGQIPAQAGKRHTEIDKRKRREDPEAEAEEKPPLPPPSRAEEYFRQRIDPDPSASSMEKLREFEVDLSPEVCIRAIDEAVNAGKRSWNYVAAILLRKQEQGIRSLEDWDRAEAQRMAGKTTANEENGNGFRGPSDLGDNEQVFRELGIFPASGRGG